MSDSEINENTRRQRTEALLTEARISELLLRPVEGNFDASHLREINRRIFQDLPAAGYRDVTPGEYRQPVDDMWIKNRELRTSTQRCIAVYSRMDREAVHELENTLNQLDLRTLTRADHGHFVGTITELYTRLDYLHPFADGNSRTLRSFTQQLADQTGWKIDWAATGVTDRAIDRLYLSRDVAVNTYALAVKDTPIGNITHPEAVRVLQAQNDRFENFKLEDTFRYLTSAKARTETPHEAVRVIVTGSLNLDSRHAAFIKSTLAEQLRSYDPANVTIVYGGSRGSDQLIDGVARQLGMHVEAHQTDRAAHGRNARQKNNQAMLDSGADRVIAFVNDDVQNSKTAADLIARAERKQIPVDRMPVPTLQQTSTQQPPKQGRSLKP